MKHTIAPWMVGKTKLLLLGVVVAAMGAGYYGAHALASNASPTAISSNSCNGTCVYIKSDGFSQDEIAIKVGEFMEFRTADGQIHNLALGNGMEAHEPTNEHDDADGHHGGEEKSTGSHDHIGGTESGEFGADEAWRVQFKKPGTFIVHDHLHPETSILIVAYGTK